MKPVRFHPAAERELVQAIAYYESQRPGLGVDFRAEIERSVALIRRDPELLAPRPDGFRGRRARRFPYTIFYLDLDKEIWVGAVAHQRRRPGYWAGRLSD